MADVSMPRLSDSMEEGTILKWLKSDGDEVKRGDELVEIETDKANMTYEADQDGVLSITASEGDTLAVGEKIATIGEAAEQPEAQEHGEEEHAEPQAEHEQEPEPEAEEEQEPEPSPNRSRRPNPRRSRKPSRSLRPKRSPRPKRSRRARTTGGPRPAPSRAGWRASSASSSRRSRAPGPAGGS